MKMSKILIICENKSEIKERENKCEKYPDDDFLIISFENSLCDAEFNLHMKDKKTYWAMKRCDYIIVEIDSESSDLYMKEIADLIRVANDLCVPIGLVSEDIMSAKNKVLGLLSFDLYASSYDDMIFYMKTIFDEHWIK